MKTYRFIVYSISFFVILTHSGCEKFLDSAPYSFTAAENFYTTAQEAEIALVGCYNTLNGNSTLFGRDLLFVLNGSTDECVARTGISNAVTPFGLAAYTSSDITLSKTWATFYEGINRANHLLARVELIDMDEARKEEIKAEAHFLRGIYHMYLSMMFGAIPVKTTADPQNSARLPVSEVYDQVLVDFQYAYEHLPHRARISGAANKWSAAGYLAKVHAYLASAKYSGMGSDLNFEPNNFNWVNADETYEKVLALTAPILANSGYKLTEHYDHLFRETTKDAQYEECLLLVEASSSATNGIWNRFSNAWLPFGPPAIGGNNSRWFVPLAEIFDKYDEADIRRSHNMTRNMTANSPIEEIGGNRYYVPEVATSPDQGFFTPGKFRQRDASQKAIPQWASDGNFPLLRLADIMLLHAEALYFTGDVAGARNTLADLRARAVDDEQDVSVLNAAYYKDDFVAELLDERSRELCFETHRRFDLARFNTYTEAITGLQSVRGVNNSVVPIVQANWAPYRIWFPVPLAELDLNSLLVQNPGY